jgi:hypothetical protein
LAKRCRTLSLDGGDRLPSRCSAGNSGGGKTAWQIGKNDNASLEFKQQWDFAKAGDPRFVVGRSSPERDWSASEPGIGDDAAGQRPQPFTISFNLDTEPRGVFYLTINVMFTNPHIPEYIVEVNGKKGRFYFRPTISSDAGDPEMAWNIIFSAQRLRIPLPAGYFQKGQNRIVLTCGNDEAHLILPEAKIPSGTPEIYYDALELTQDSEAKFRAGPAQPSATPTIFYRRQASGLSEVVLLKAATVRRYAVGSAKLQVGKQIFTCRLSSDFDFGESECPVDVPEFRREIPAKLTVTTGKQTVSASVSLSPQKNGSCSSVR